MPELPADFELPKLRDKRLDNLTYHEGRTPGAINRITKDLKTGILNGAIAHGADGRGKDGLDGYLCMCAARYPKHYLQVLAKLPPLQVHGEGFAGPSIGTIQIVAVPHDHYLSAEDIAKVRGEPYQPPEPRNATSRRPSRFNWKPPSSRRSRLNCLRWIMIN